MKKRLCRFMLFLVVFVMLAPSFSLAESWTCSFDRTVNSSNYCTTCGRSKSTASATICPSCKATCKSGDRFCGNCGAPLSGQRTVIRVGDIVTFGTYEQTYAGEPIEWIVLSTDGGKLKLLSKYVLECRQMSSSNSTAWKNTKMYSWLQTTFYNTAFTVNEQYYIIPDLEGTVVNIPSREDLCDKRAGFSSDPNADDDLRVGIGTPHAHRQGLWKGPTSGACNYFTRSEVNTNSNGLVWHLHTGGSFGKTGKDRTNEGIRPLIYVSASYFQ